MSASANYWSKEFREMPIPGNTTGDKIKWMNKMGYSYTMIEARLQCSKGTISYHLGNGQKAKYLRRQRKAKRNNRSINSTSYKRAISSVVQSVLMFNQTKRG